MQVRLAKDGRALSLFPQPGGGGTADSIAIGRLGLTEDPSGMGPLVGISGSGRSRSMAHGTPARGRAHGLTITRSVL
jgi:hypothetical protein